MQSNRTGGGGGGIKVVRPTFHVVGQVPHFLYHCWAHFQITFREEGKNSTEQPACLLSSPQSWECMLLFNKPRTRLLAHKQRRWCIIHFGAVAPPRWGTKRVWCTTWAITRISPHQTPCQASSKTNKQSFPCRLYSARRRNFRLLAGAQ